MKLQLERLFVEGEQERIQIENQEKKQAEQIAAGEWCGVGVAMVWRYPF